MACPFDTLRNCDHFYRQAQEIGMVVKALGIVPMLISTYSKGNWMIEFWKANIWKIDVKTFGCGRKPNFMPPEKYHFRRKPQDSLYKRSRFYTEGWALAFEYSG